MCLIVVIPFIPHANVCDTHLVSGVKLEMKVVTTLNFIHTNWLFWFHPSTIDFHEGKKYFKFYIYVHK
jgi:hypothetical protein